jgi:hypothetical protein
MIKSYKLRSALIAITLAGTCQLAWSGEVAEGTVLSAANIDALKNETLEGKPVGSMLTEKMEWRIRNNGWKLSLFKSKEIPLDPKWVKASNANIGKTKINPETREIEGWTAGAPFPNVEASDPQIAEKLIWNWHLGQLSGDSATAKTWTQLLIDGKKGIHAEPIAEFTRYNMKGRLNGPSAEGNGKERSRQLLFFKEPAEMKGLGTFTSLYDSAQVPDAWVYIPAVRRVRRLSGGAWMDPVGSSDQLQDDLEIFNARPSWYKSYKLLSKRWVLAAANSKLPAWNPNGKAFAERRRRGQPLLELPGRRERCGGSQHLHVLPDAPADASGSFRPATRGGRETRNSRPRCHRQPRSRLPSPAGCKRRHTPRNTATQEQLREPPDSPWQRSASCSATSARARSMRSGKPSRATGSRWTGPTSSACAR